MSVDTPLRDAANAAVAPTGERPPAARAAHGQPRPPTGLRSKSRSVLRYAVRHPGLTFAALYVTLVILSALAPAIFTGQNPDLTDGAIKLTGPTWNHLFGTDELGRDLFTRVVYGSRLTLEGTAIAVAFAAVAGLTLGTLSGFVGGWVDAVIMRLVDVLLAIPPLLLALLLVTALGFGEVQVALAVGFGITPGFSRTTRAEVLRVKTLPYVEAARTGGAGWLRVMLRHVLPNSTGPLLALAVLDVGTSVLVISALSFLGFGVPPPRADWGSLISDGSQWLITNPYMALLPGIFVVLLVFSVNHIALAIQEHQRR
jgi:peptide/nickel transport system permease protein